MFVEIWTIWGAMTGIWMRCSRKMIVEYLDKLDGGNISRLGSFLAFLILDTSLCLHRRRFDAFGSTLDAVNLFGMLGMKRGSGRKNA